MTERVPANRIEALVGAKRHPWRHIIRGAMDGPDAGLAYILHPDDCRNHWDDLRDCPWSLALDRGGVWLPDDLPHHVRLRNGELLVDMNPWGTDE